MIAFRHSDVSPADSAWLDGPLRNTDWLDAPTSRDQVLVLAAHPDDETLGAGGLIATAHARGARIIVVVASDGEASHPASPTHPPEALARRRRREVGAAVRRLAPDASVHFLGLPDGRLTEVEEAVATQVESLAAGATHVVAPWEGDGHPDHAACGRVAAAAARRLGAECWQYPIWAWHWAEADDGDALPWNSIARVRLGPRELAAKQDAIGTHVSQHSPLSDQAGDEAILGPDMIAHFERPFETFVVAPEDDSGHHDAGDPAYFDRLYSRAGDPWGLGTRFYESRKRSVLLAALPRAQFARAFEPGCATGLLTEELGRRCRSVLAWDVARSAVTATAQRLATVPHVRVERGAIPQDWPDGRFDLIVLSEVGYYCRDLDALADRAWGSLTDDGVIVACHWRHPAPDHPHSADAVHDALDRPGHRVVSHLEGDFRLDVWSATGRSVAAETGVIA
jgi:LmbE family N-acetylglucosaminyl deacetylase/SAM-dependent methyltransferase